MMSDNIYNRKSLKETRQHLRNNATPAEKLLWKALQGSQLAGRKFRRQHSIGNYIVDFYCPTEKLVIELDGAQHFSLAGQEADIERDTFLNSLGIQVLRFENKLVLESLESVLERIRQAIETNHP